MVVNVNTLNLTPEEYLVFEETSDLKHEYRQGQAYAMAGASNNHVLIAGNLFALIRFQIRGKNCRAYISDTKVKIESLKTYYYPDIAVSCDQRDQKLTQYISHPCLIVEVLSESTEAFDRGDKFADYRQLESLKEYVLISQHIQRIDTFYKNEQGQWILYSYSENDQLMLKSINFYVSISEIYEDVTL